MFERFTDRSRRVMVLAQEESRLLGHSYIGTEHVLLALIAEAQGVAAQVLHSHGLSVDTVRQQITQIVGVAAGSPSGHIPFTPRSKKVLEFALREALQLGHNYIGTEHVLLGLLREGEGVGCQVIVAAGVELSTVRLSVIHRIVGRPDDDEQYHVDVARIAAVYAAVLSEPIVQNLITRRVVARLRAEGTAP